MMDRDSQIAKAQACARKKFGESKREGEEWVGSEAESLANVTGLDRLSAILLQLVGIENLHGLAQCDAEEVFAAIRRMNEKEQFVRRPPSLATIRGWILMARYKAEAGRLPNRLRE